VNYFIYLLWKSYSKYSNKRKDKKYIGQR